MKMLRSSKRAFFSYFMRSKNEEGSGSLLIGGVLLTEKRELPHCSYASIFTIRENDLQTGKDRTNTVKRKLEPKIEKAMIRKHLALKWLHVSRARLITCKGTEWTSRRDHKMDEWNLHRSRESQTCLNADNKKTYQFSDRNVDWKQWTALPANHCCQYPRWYVSNDH